MSKRTRDLLVAQREELLIEQSQADAIDVAIREIRWKIDIYADNEEAVSSINDRMQLPSDLQTVAVLHRHRMKLLKAKANAHIAVLRDYVDLLDSLGMLRQEERVNWLSSTNS